MIVIGTEKGEIGLNGGKLIQIYESRVDKIIYLKISGGAVISIGVLDKKISVFRIVKKGGEVKME